MKPILAGARGAAVEDIQRRLLMLGYDLGPTGVDGVFLGMTADAIRSFQAQHEIAQDGVVGGETWSALVDATFTLGDRMLYLRMPYFHGQDVKRLQEALSTLGFSCGDVDGIFGGFTESAVREFQRNSGQSADGIVGPETVSAIIGLRHVWEGKDASTPVVASVTRSRSVEPLLQTRCVLRGEDPLGQEIAMRAANVARASDERVELEPDEDGPTPDLILTVSSAYDAPAEGVPVVQIGSDPLPSLTARIVTALSSMTTDCREIVVAVDDADTDEQALQRVAVRLLDAVCAALA